MSTLLNEEGKQSFHEFKESFKFQKEKFNWMCFNLIRVKNQLKIYQGYDGLSIPEKKKMFGDFFFIS